MTDFDLVVIGAGPGGYVAAIRAAQLGLRTACVEKWRDGQGRPVLGGTCLNVGCIPSKALLDSSHLYEQLRSHAAEHGIQAAELTMDVAAMQARKDKVVQTLTGGVAGLFKKHKIELVSGQGRLLKDRRVEVRDADGGTSVLSAKQVVIATGSAPVALGAAPVDGEYIVDSTGALEFGAVPERLGVIGAGVIGLELGSVWRRLGAQVTVLEALPDFLPAVDADIAREALRQFKRQKLDLRLGAKVSATQVSDGEVAVHYEAGGTTEKITVNRLIVAVGRRPVAREAVADDAGVSIDRHGFIEVDEYCRTAVPGIYAIGDAVRGPMLAHKAMDEGAAVAECIAGQRSRVDLGTVPWVIYTWPEIAWVGPTEQDLKAQGVDYRSGSFPFAANGRARAMGETAGMVKMLADRATDRLLGVHILGPQASELVAEAVLALEFEASAEDVARSIHAHPTLSEALHEAALAVDGRTLHL